ACPSPSSSSPRSAGGPSLSPAPPPAPAPSRTPSGPGRASSSAGRARRSSEKERKSVFRMARQQWMRKRKSHLHVLDLAQVSVLGGEQQSSGLIQLRLHTQRLVVQQRELRLQALVLRSLFHNFFRNVPQVHLPQQVMEGKSMIQSAS
uniref:Uncharacterized protein n=1 Tax=Denticeps clupeoides TaxID=299321 RepID=A0AAY4ASH6_9TELE